MVLCSTQYDKLLDTHVNSVGELNKYLVAIKAVAPGSAEAVAQATEALPKVAGYRKDCRSGCASALYAECKKVADKALTSLTDAITPPPPLGGARRVVALWVRPGWFLLGL